MGINPGNSKQTTHHFVLALDFGGTKLAAAVVDLESEKIIGKVIRRPTPVSDGAQGSLDAMIECGRQAMGSVDGAVKVSAAGISFGGPVSRDRQSVMLSNHIANWKDIPLASIIRNAFSVPACMDNDGNAAALGEWHFGGHRAADNLVYIQTSTGIGGGFIFDRQLYRGGGLAGEPGHYLVDANGPRCSCGSNGCLESLSSGWAIARDGRKAITETPEKCPILCQLSGNQAFNVDAAMVFSAARVNDPACVQIIQTALGSLAGAVVNLVTCLDPGVVVIGGGLTRSRDMFDEYFFPVVQKQIRPLFRDRCEVTISTMDGNELLMGAALLTKLNYPV